MNSDNTDAHSLAIEYALTRAEIVQSFWRSVARSPKFRNTILLYSIAIGVFSLLFQFFQSRAVAWSDLVIAALFAAGCFFIFFPLWMFVSGKTGKRTLTVSRDGIATQIGRMKVQIPWQKVGVVSNTPHFVLIVRTNGNAFFIPNRAFSGADERDQFLNAVGSWTSKT